MRSRGRWNRTAYIASLRPSAPVVEEKEEDGVDDLSEEQALEVEDEVAAATAAAAAAAASEDPSCWRTRNSCQGRAVAAADEELC